MSKLEIHTAHLLGIREAERRLRMDKIEKRDSKWLVLSADGSRILGSHDTEDDAKRHLRAIEAAKARRKDYPFGRNTRGEGGRYRGHKPK
jgi:hypothetical protein